MSEAQDIIIIKSVDMDKTCRCFKKTAKCFCFRARPEEVSYVLRFVVKNDKASVIFVTSLLYKDTCVITYHDKFSAFDHFC